MFQLLQLYCLRTTSEHKKWIDETSFNTSNKEQGPYLSAIDTFKHGKQEIVTPIVEYVPLVYICVRRGTITFPIIKYILVFITFLPLKRNSFRSCVSDTCTGDEKRIKIMKS